MEIYQKIFLAFIGLVAFLLLTRKRDTKFDKEYYDIINSEKYKVKGQY